MRAGARFALGFGLALAGVSTSSRSCSRGTCAGDDLDGESLVAVIRRLGRAGAEALAEV